jgi:hypothetical protein
MINTSKPRQPLTPEQIAAYRPQPQVNAPQPVADPVRTLAYQAGIPVAAAQFLIEVLDAHAKRLSALEAKVEEVTANKK